MEMSQDTIVAFIVSLMAATFFNKYSFNFNINEDNPTILAKTLIEFIILIIVLYYIRKVISIVPFLFKYTTKYIPGRPSTDGEGLLGKVVTVAIVFSTIVVKLKAKIKHISGLI
jgi:hypothetical protein